MDLCRKMKYFYSKGDLYHVFFFSSRNEMHFIEFSFDLIEMKFSLLMKSNYSTMGWTIIQRINNNMLHE